MSLRNIRPQLTRENSSNVRIVSGAAKSVAAALLLGLAACQPSSEPETSITEIQQPAWKSQVADLVDDNQIPGAVVYQIKAGEVVDKFVTGYQDPAQSVPVQEDTIFRLYSMSKPLTSVAIMMLVDEGKLGLDTALETVLPDFNDMEVYESGDLDNMVTQPIDRSMTIADLLTHQAGITYHFTGTTPVHQYYRKYGVMRDTPVGRTPEDGEPAKDLSQLVERLGDAPMLHQPGDRFSYSYSTTVLGAVIEAVSGTTLDDYLQDNLFEPLDMTHTGFFITDEDKDLFIDNFVLGADGLNMIENWENTDYKDRSRLLDGGGAIAGTASDYANFVEMLGNQGEFNGQVLLKPETFQTMLTPHVNASFGEAAFKFGYGFQIGDEQSEAAGRLPESTVGWSGSGNTYFWVDPNTGDGVVFMTQVIIPGEFADVGVEFRQIMINASTPDQ